MGIFGKPPDVKPTPSVVPPNPPAAPPPPRPPVAAAPQREPSPGAATLPVRSTTCVIGAKTVIKGELSGDEDMLVEGTIEGQIRTSRDLRVGPGGVVKATVSAQSIIVSGEL